MISEINHQSPPLALISFIAGQGGGVIRVGGWGTRNWGPGRGGERTHRSVSVHFKLCHGPHGVVVVWGLVLLESQQSVVACRIPILVNTSLVTKDTCDNTGSIDMGVLWCQIIRKILREELETVLVRNIIIPSRYGCRTCR